jgi:hypothetical protein
MLPIYFTLGVILTFFVILASLTCYLFLTTHAARTTRVNQAQVVISQIKKFSFSNLTGRDGEVCSICLSDYEDKDDVVQLKCSKYHIFHYDCI